MSKEQHLLNPDEPKHKTLSTEHSWNVHQHEKKDPDGKREAERLEDIQHKSWWIWTQTRFIIKHKLMFSSAEEAPALLIQLLFLAKLWRRDETLYKTPSAWFILHHTLTFKGWEFWSHTGKYKYRSSLRSQKKLHLCLEN